MKIESITNFGIKESLNNVFEGSNAPLFPLLRDFSISETLQLIGLLDWQIPKQKPIFPSFRELSEQLKIYPEAKNYLKYKLNVSKQIIENTQFLKYLNYKNYFWLDIIEELYIKPNENIIKKISLLFKNKKNILNIEKAKLFPITELLEFKNNKTKCIFHNDTNPSFNYFPKNNTTYCFSCSTFADSIKIYQTLNNCSFIEAVKALQ